MALRQLAAVGSGRWGACLRPFSTAPSVYDKLVQLTVVDLAGRRHVVRGLEGQTVVDLLEGHVDTLGDETLCLSPEGRGARETHIKLPTELMGSFPPHSGDDARFLVEIAEPKALDRHSRLGSKVTLSKELEGTVLALAPVYPWKTL
ncbi:hypothetical protein D9Q98_000929 [Chlorella vulgaris]|uniref:Uncharacterized protein n=1 Tax=Chlorella vulgaris TaxID=3077 RepID=A0A9D4TYY5_CHLVU|nr:hypothetical protein D9Q98_000929 [Chlorella vulgaris]